MKKLIITFIYLLLVVPCMAEDNPDNYSKDGFPGSQLASVAEDSKPVRYAPNQIIVKFRDTTANLIEKQLVSKNSTNGLQLSSNLNELKARYRAKRFKPLFKNFKAKRQHLKNLLQKDKALLTKRQKRILRRLRRAPKDANVPELDRIYTVEVQLEPDQSLEEVINAYNKVPDVEYAELNYIVSINTEPNDSLYPIQWPLNNTGQIYPASGRFNSPPGTPDSDIDAHEAWSSNAEASEVVVAVIDTGVDYTHRDLDDNMWINQVELSGTTGVDDDENGYIDDIYGYDFTNNDADPIDDHGHGTHCAGIIAAEGNNAQDIAGICWNGSIMALKFLGRDGSGSSTDALEAFYYAVENGADVVSNSWGGGGFSQAMQDVVDYAYSQGVMMVASAGNNGTTDVQYPANYDHMLSVAATNSEDQKAPFSTYGSWVDIAAPGVDVLSLRAAGTSLGTTYDPYTTIASGTSMSCPHVAGACAFLLSIYHEITPDQLEAHLENSADPIDPNICASGRLNLNKARLQVASPEGKIYLDSDVYSCSEPVTIRLLDLDLAGNTTQPVIVSTDGGDFEIVTLTELTSSIGIFTGTILTDSTAPDINDSLLQVSNGQIITVIYDDENDGTGTPVTVTNTAVIDCQAPVIFDIRTGFPGRKTKITFETDEPTTGRVLCGLICAGPYIIDKSDMTLRTSHTIELTGLAPETKYFFVIEANDNAGNKTVVDKNGRCYKFTTTGVGDIYVPAQVPTIQAGIDVSWAGGVVWVADGIYTGPGNRDIDFKGMPITVRSQNGPERCIVDCNGTETYPHRGFYFHSGEDNNSVLHGFTITNGYIPGSWDVGIGGGILCINDSSPTINNCIVTENSAGWDGGGICNLFSSPNINNCSFIANSAIGNDGGGINNDNSSPTITNCIFSGNSAYDWGGAIRNIYNCDPTVINCTIVGNSSDDGAGMFYWTDCEPNIINCTFTENVARNGNALGYDSGSRNISNNIQLINCILADDGNEIWNNDNSMIAVTYSNIQGGWIGTGNIDADPYFVDANNGNYHLLPYSPCIDTGDPNYVSEPNETDLDGKPRIINGRIDMGPYELLPDPSNLLEKLSDKIDAMNLPKGTVNNLLTKLNHAIQLLEDNNENNDTAAINSLEAFINAVDAQRGKKISEVDADSLITAAQEIIELLTFSLVESSFSAPFLICTIALPAKGTSKIISSINGSPFSLMKTSGAKTSTTGVLA